MTLPGPRPIDIARAELADEAFRAAVEAEKAKLRTRQSLRQRLLSWVPRIAITWKR